MKYNGQVSGNETVIVIEKEGIRINDKLLDYADVESILPINHRIRIRTFSQGELEISMLGFSYDGFWEELMDCFGNRSLESLFVDEEQIMLCEGEYTIPQGSGRGKIALYPDSICILPQTCHAIRIPLCFTERLWLDGYSFHILMQTGEQFTVGKMGYDTKPFAERAEKTALQTKNMREKALRDTPLNEPFEEKGLFRTKRPEQYWNASFGAGVCAVELFTGEDAATYLYRFSEPREQFLKKLEIAMEAMGTHREVIYMSNEQLSEKSLYLMTVNRTPAVTYLREHSAGRLIHGKNYNERLKEFLRP